MARFRIVPEHGGEVSVWIGLEDEDPIAGPGFVIGVGITIEKALKDSELALRDALNELSVLQAAESLLRMEQRMDIVRHS